MISILTETHTSNPNSLPTHMKIAILTLGTRGDAQPFAVLGQALKQRGHGVTLSTAKNFESLVKSYGLHFVPVEADYQALLQSEEGKRLMKANPFVVQRNLKKFIYPLVRQSLTEFYKLAKASDRVVYHVKTMADSFADQFPDKMIRAMVVPAVQPTSEFPNPALSGFPIPRFLNRISYKVNDLGIAMLKKPVGQFRESMGLSKGYSIPDTKFLYGISEHLLKKPDDLPKAATFTGFWFGTTKGELTKDLEEFIRGGEAPLLITFGSMPFKSKFDLQKAILRIAEQLSVRIIVVKGWGLDETEQLEEDSRIKVISGAPYEKLFPFVKAVVHHGGLGTTAECLRAGKPMMVCPILHPVGDQQFWGELAEQKGLAVKPVPMSKMTEERFLKGIRALLTNEQLYFNAQKIKGLICHEDGIGKSVKEIEKESIL